jgi:tRNA G46 methylase TrmB
LKEIVLVSDHPTTEVRLDRLLSLIYLLKSNGKKVALSSHILIPEFITKKCDLKENGKLLEIGFGNGSFLSTFSKINPTWKLVGTEFDD